MSASLWVWGLAGIIVVALVGGVRWAIGDFLLDQFGSLPEWFARRSGATGMNDRCRATTRDDGGQSTA